MTAAGAFVSSVGWELGKEPEITSPRNGRIDRSGLPQASPVENPMPWLDRSVYPPAALAAGIEGRVVLTVEVDASGSATGCRIVVSSGSNLLDSGTCDVLRARGKFRPAVDAMGMRVDGGWTTTVTWMI